MSQTGNAITLIRKYEQPEGYFVAFSGGKDSIVMYDLVKRAGVKFQVYFSFTTVDPPELILFLRQFYPEVNFLRPAKSMYQLIIDKGLPTIPQNLNQSGSNHPGNRSALLLSTILNQPEPGFAHELSPGWLKPWLINGQLISIYIQLSAPKY